MSNSNGQKISTRSMTYVALFSVIIALCSWISIPASVPFTLQTFAVFCAVGLLGGKLGTLSVIVYILLGAVGIPVFAGFTGGVGILFGSTGGYILGFVVSAVAYWILTSVLGEKTWVMATAMFVGLILCYVVGTAWFIFVYQSTKGSIDLITALGWCVFPFIIPDALKIVLAIFVTKKVKKHVKL